MGGGGDGATATGVLGDSRGGVLGEASGGGGGYGLGETVMPALGDGGVVAGAGEPVGMPVGVPGGATFPPTGTVGGATSFRG